MFGIRNTLLTVVGYSTCPFDAAGFGAFYRDESAWVESVGVMEDGLVN